MIRRQFLRLLAVIPIVGLARPAAAAFPYEPTSGLWIPTKTWEKDFPWNPRVKAEEWGYCMEFKNRITGELARQAVRFGKFEGFTCIEARKMARTILFAWAEDLPMVLGREPAHHYDRCLEGNEIRA